MRVGIRMILNKYYVDGLSKPNCESALLLCEFWNCAIINRPMTAKITSLEKQREQSITNHAPPLLSHSTELITSTHTTIWSFFLNSFLFKEMKYSWQVQRYYGTISCPFFFFKNMHRTWAYKWYMECKIYIYLKAVHMCAYVCLCVFLFFHCKVHVYPGAFQS